MEKQNVVDAIYQRVQFTLAALGCANALVSVRLTDVDTEPEPGPYVDVAISARIRVADYVAMVAHGR